MTALLEVRSLTAGYGDSSVLQGVDLAVGAGEVLALMGRNGMGKTTLLRRIMGLLPPRDGEIRFAGQDITAVPAHRIARLGLGYVAQGRALFEGLSVEQNLRLGLLGTGARSLPAQIFAWFPILAERRRQRAGTLSGGEQQMLALARALAAEPAMILLDEPSEGVQPSVVHELGETLAEVVRASRLTLLLVEQNVDLVTTLAGRVAFMDKGRIVESTGVGALAEPAGPLQRHLSL